MSFQEKLFETTADLRARASTIATEALATARARAEVAAKRLEVLTVAGREFNKVARRHVVRFVKENSTIAAAARKDVSALARSTFATLANRPTTKSKGRKPAARTSRGGRPATIPTRRIHCDRRHSSPSPLGMAISMGVSRHRPEERGGVLEIPLERPLHRGRRG